MNIVKSKVPVALPVAEAPVIQEKPTREIASESEAVKYFTKNSTKKIAKIKKPGKPKVMNNIKVYGLESEILETFSAPLPPENKADKRIPASSESPAKIQDAFESSVKQEYDKEVRKPSSDVNNLIDQLKSYQSEK